MSEDTTALRAQLAEAQATIRLLLAEREAMEATARGSIVAELHDLQATRTAEQERADTVAFLRHAIAGIGPSTPPGRILRETLDFIASGQHEGAAADPPTPMATGLNGLRAIASGIPGVVAVDATEEIDDDRMGSTICVRVQVAEGADEVEVVAALAAALEPHRPATVRYAVRLAG